MRGRDLEPTELQAESVDEVLETLLSYSHSPVRQFYLLNLSLGFSGSSPDKESTCKAGGPSSIPGSGRFPGEGISYPLQYSWVSLVAQLVKNLPEMQETPVQFLGQEDSLEKG